MSRPHTQALLGMMVLAILVGLAARHRPDADPVVRTVVLDENPSAVAVDTRTGHAFVATGSAGEPGHVSMVDMATGGLLRTVPVGLDPTAVAVDERGGRGAGV